VSDAIERVLKGTASWSGGAEENHESIVCHRVEIRTLDILNVKLHSKTRAYN
jgi:hypothetical protein